MNYKCTNVQLKEKSQSEHTMKLPFKTQTRTFQNLTLFLSLLVLITLCVLCLLHAKTPCTISANQNFTIHGRNVYLRLSYFLFTWSVFQFEFLRIYQYYKNLEQKKKNVRCIVRFIISLF